MDARMPRRKGGIMIAVFYNFIKSFCRLRCSGVRRPAGGSRSDLFDKRAWATSPRAARRRWHRREWCGWRHKELWSAGRIGLIHPWTANASSSAQCRGFFLLLFFFLNVLLIPFASIQIVYFHVFIYLYHCFRIPRKNLIHFFGIYSAQINITTRSESFKKKDNNNTSLIMNHSVRLNYQPLTVRVPRVLWKTTESKAAKRSN